MTSIRAENVTYEFPDGTVAVRGIDFEVEEGAFFGFLGPNGAGKTTTVKLLTTLHRPTAGRVEVNGYDPERNPTAVRRSIGYMSQETSVDETLTARENLAFSCRAYGVPASERAEKIARILSLVELDEVADDRVRKFSVGMKKRLDAASALVHEPPIVFLDEPTTGLDPRVRYELWDYFERLNESGMTVFLTTQYLREADRLCSDLAVIADGEILVTGSPSGLKKRVGETVVELELADTDPARLARAHQVIGEEVEAEEPYDLERTDDGFVIRSPRADDIGIEAVTALSNWGFSVRGYEVRPPTLDDVFFEVTDERRAEAAEDGPANGRERPVEANR